MSVFLVSACGQFSCLLCTFFLLLSLKVQDLKNPCSITTAVSIYRQLVVDHDSQTWLKKKQSFVILHKCYTFSLLFFFFKPNSYSVQPAFFPSNFSYRVPAGTSETEYNNNNNNSTSPQVPLGALSMMVYLRSMTGRAQLRLVCSGSTQSDLHEDNDETMGPP